nr:uncharacterized protein LOC111515566 [Leptinotarsa decemlineata]
MLGGEGEESSPKKQHLEEKLGMRFGNSSNQDKEQESSGRDSLDGEVWNIFSNKDNENDIGSTREFTSSLQNDNNMDREVNEEDVRDNEQIITYSEGMPGPFLVMVEMNEELGGRAGRFSHLKIAKEICDLKLYNIIRIKIKGKNKVGIEFNNINSANEMIEDDRLKNKGYKVYIPYSYVTCKAVVKEISTDFTDIELKKLIKSPIKVLNVKRMNRRLTSQDGTVQYVPASTILITFKGNIIPRYIDICYLTYVTTPYVPPIAQCYNCLLYGHIKKNCKGHKNVFHAQHNIKKKKSITTVSISNVFFVKVMIINLIVNIVRSLNGKKKIREKMTFDNISFYEAVKFFPKQSRTFHLQSQQFPTLNNGNVPMNDRILVEQRREVFANNNMSNKRSFAQSIRVKNSNKRTESRQGYDRQALNEILINPDGRISQPSNGIVFQHAVNNRNTGTIKKPIVQQTNSSNNTKQTSDRLFSLNEDTEEKMLFLT